MISWIIILLGVLFMWGVLLKVIRFGEGEDERTGELLAGLAVACLVVVCVSTSAYQDFISLPLEYKNASRKINEIKNLIKDKPLIMADISINQNVARLIGEKNDILKKVQENNISPFALFKIDLSN